MSKEYRFGVLVSKDLHEAGYRKASVEGRQLSDVIRRLVRMWLEGKVDPFADLNSVKYLQDDPEAWASYLRISQPPIHPAETQSKEKGIEVE